MLGVATFLGKHSSGLGIAVAQSLEPLEEDRILFVMGLQKLVEGFFLAEGLLGVELFQGLVGGRVDFIVIVNVGSD